MLRNRRSRLCYSAAGQQAPRQFDINKRSFSSTMDRPLLTLGVISDVQFAPLPDGFSYHGTPRYYRNALVALRRAVDCWNNEEDRPPSCVLNLGDVIDGFCPKDQSEQLLALVLSEFDRLKCPYYSLLGNHECYNLPRSILNCRLRLGDPEQLEGPSYYSVNPHPYLRVVMLDGYDVSLHGWPEGHPLHTQAFELLRDNNPNKMKNSTEGLVGVARRFAGFGGGVSAAQLTWLQTEIQAAEAAGQRVLVCCHLPLCAGTCPYACLLWNFQEVLDILHLAARGTVIATLAGHAHQNGYACDKAGIHHIVVPAVLETPPGRDAYGRLDVWADGSLTLRGVDTMLSLDLPAPTISDASSRHAPAASGKRVSAVLQNGRRKQSGAPAGVMPT